MGLFNRHQLSIILKLTVFLNKCIGRAKTNVSLIWGRPVAKKMWAFSFKFTVNGFHYFPVFVRSWLSLTDLKEGPQTGNKTGCCNRKIEIWKLASEVQFIFSVNIEKRCQILSFVFLVGWNLKFESSFSIFWKLKIKVRFWYFSLAEMFCFSILEQLHNQWNFFIGRLWTTSLFRVLSLTQKKAQGKCLRENKSGAS